MQGRLSPMVNGMIQAFPAAHWKQEFELASQHAFDLIEWVIDSESLAQNPLIQEAGRADIAEHINTYGIAVPYVCCDFLMTDSIQKTQPDQAFAARPLLEHLVKSAPEIGVIALELPLLGASDIDQQPAYDEAVRYLQELQPLLEDSGCRLLLEVGVSSKRTAELMDRLNTDWIQLNYDTGNSAFWQRDTEEEFRLFGDCIGNVHIKDCTPEAYSVALGEGCVDFDLTFSLLKKHSYQGDFVLQTARGENDVETAVGFLNFTKEHLDRMFL
jgi:hexulose-6-phosphate isomerase